MPSTAPLFLESETYSSVLYLVNQLKFGAQVNVSLYDMSGALLTTKQIYMDPNSQQSVSIKRVLSDGGLFSQAGSVEIVSPQNAAGILGQLSITRQGTASAYLDEELFMPDHAGSQTLRAVIDSPETSPVVAVTNVSSTDSQTLSVTCVPSVGLKVSKSLLIQPKQTKLVLACNVGADTAYSADGLDAQFVLNNHPPLAPFAQGVAGITITSSGPPGELAAFGFVEHDDAFGRYFSAANFFDPKLMNSSAFVFTGVPIGASHSLSTVSYTPQIGVTNFSDLPQTVTVSLAHTTSGLSQSTQVASFQVLARASKLLPLLKLSGDPDWQNSFLVSTTGKPGDVIAKMMFKAPGSLPNVELLGKDELHTQNTGDHPWSIENGTRSNLYLFNHGTSKKTVTVRIGSGQQIWLRLYDLQPNETRALPINELIQAGALDDDGHALSSKLTSGEVSWWFPSSGSPEVSGRVVQMDAAGTMARNFSCYNYTALCEATTIPQQQFDLYFGEGDGSISASPSFCEYPANPNNSCPNDGLYTPMNTSLSWSWASGNTGIASITSGAASQSSRWYGAGVGNTSATVRVHPTSNYQNTCQTTTPTNVAPTISGTMHDLWYFNGVKSQSGGATQFATTITLTADPPSGVTWQATSGASEVTLSPNGGTLSVTASGQAFSQTASDISITATANGMTSSAYNLTVYRPYKLVQTAHTHTCSSGYGYLDELDYDIYDSLGRDVSNLYEFDFNENFPTGFVMDNGSNWGPPNTGPATNSQVQDFISGVGINNQPPFHPVPVCSGSGVQAQHASQEYRVGSLTTGSGARVQTNQWIRFIDHATHSSIVSPAP